MIHYDTLLQNAIDIITKCYSYSITKCNRNLLQNVSGFLLQNATVITNCDDFITHCDSTSSHQRCYIKGAFLKIFAIFQHRRFPVNIAKFLRQLLEKHLLTAASRSSEDVLYRSAAFLKKRLSHRCIPVNFAKFLRTTFLQNTSGRLLLSF